MKKIILTALFSISIIQFSTASDAWCIARPNQDNPGYCTEGLDGKGKCVTLKVEGADRCQADQPDENPTIN